MRRSFTSGRDGGADDAAEKIYGEYVERSA